MGIGATQGHFNAFFWGQNYGGLESILVGAVFFLFGPSNASIFATTAMLSFAGCFLFWRSARRLLDSRLLALTLGAIAALFPTATLVDLAQPYGFRTTGYFLSYALLLAALAIWQETQRSWRWALAGLLAGLAWWASPEIAYLGLAAFLIVLSAIWRLALWRQRLKATVLLLAGFGLAALPWFWVSLVEKINPLHSAATETLNFHGRFLVFFSHVLPQLFGFQQILSGHGIFVGAGGFSHACVVIFLVGILFFAALVALRRPGPSRALGIAVFASPFIYASSPPSWYWLDCRYAIYLLPLYLLVLAIGFESFLSWRKLELKQQSRVTFTYAVSLLALVATLSWSIWQLNIWKASASGNDAGWFSAWDSSDAGMATTARELEGQGIRVGWADYWIAYRLTFDSKMQLNISPTPNAQVRNRDSCRAVKDSSQAVWLISGASSPSGLQPDAQATAPGNLQWRDLRFRFDRLGVHWSAKLIASLWVISTTSPVSPTQVGLKAEKPGIC